MKIKYLISCSLAGLSTLLFALVIPVFFTYDRMSILFLTTFICGFAYIYMAFKQAYINKYTGSSIVVLFLTLLFIFGLSSFAPIDSLIFLHMEKVVYIIFVPFFLLIVGFIKNNNKF